MSNGGGSTRKSGNASPKIVHRLPQPFLDVLTREMAFKLTQHCTRTSDLDANGLVIFLSQGARLVSGFCPGKNAPSMRRARFGALFRSQ